MIQRIQTIWLIISTLSSGLLIKGGIIEFVDKAGQEYFTGFSGIYKLNGSGYELVTNSVPLAAVIILILVLSIITILLFKRRKIQKVLSLVLITFSLCMIILITYYSFILMKNYDAEFVPGVKMVIPLIILIALVLAYKGISRDDNIVKSYDRLR
jgi:hypothetical protein